jgi:hypothetical protein
MRIKSGLIPRLKNYINDEDDIAQIAEELFGEDEI